VDAANFGMLGPLTVTVNDRTVRVSAAKQRIILGVLLVRANHIVTTDRLLHELWLDTPPKTGIGTLHSLLSRLRRLIAAPAVRLEHGAGGYRLSVPTEAVDTFRFEQLGKRGSDDAAEGRAERAAEALSEALSMWQGDFLLDVPQTPLITAEASRLGELRIDLTERRLEMICGWGVTPASSPNYVPWWPTIRTGNGFGTS
jgi:DNA-binding SARP family transcriptional activator